jgi:predicted component of type VI protein secretion system
MKAELVPDNGDPPIPITRDVTVVGRRAYCDIRIEDESLSKRHCVLVKTDGLLLIRDLASTNGTKVKGQRIRWAALLPDDRITLGAYKLRVYLGPDDLPAPSELPRGTARPRPAQRASANEDDTVRPQPKRVVPDAEPMLAELDVERADIPEGFDVPSPPLGTPAVPADGFWATDDSDDESAWRDQFKIAADEGDVIIELD